MAVDRREYRRLIRERDRRVRRDRFAVAGGLLLLAALAALGRPAVPATTAVAATPVPKAASVAGPAVSVASLLRAEDGWRAARKLPALRRDAALDAAALAMARDMASRGYFSAVDPDGRTPYDRAGGTWSRVAANLLQDSTASLDASGVLAAWDATPPYRQNLASGGWAATGVAAWKVPGSPGSVLWVQLFAAD